MSRIDTQIAAIERDVAQAQARLRDLAAQRNAKARRDNARRKIVLGSALERLLDTLGEQERRTLLGRVHDHVTRAKDRQFLGLPLRPAPDQPTLGGYGVVPEPASASIDDRPIQQAELPFG